MSAFQFRKINPGPKNVHQIKAITGHRNSPLQLFLWIEKFEVSSFRVPVHVLSKPSFDLTTRSVTSDEKIKQIDFDSQPPV